MASQGCLWLLIGTFEASHLYEVSMTVLFICKPYVVLSLDRYVGQSSHVFQLYSVQLNYALEIMYTLILMIATDLPY